MARLLTAVFLFVLLLLKSLFLKMDPEMNIPIGLKHLLIVNTQIILLILLLNTGRLHGAITLVAAPMLSRTLLLFLAISMMLQKIFMKIFILMYCLMLNKQ